MSLMMASLQVVDVRAGPCFGVEDEARALPDQARDGAVRVVEVTEDARLGGAVFDACGVLAFRQPGTAVIALLVVEVPVVVGAGHHARPATHALLGVDVDDAVFGVMAGRGRARLDAW